MLCAMIVAFKSNQKSNNWQRNQCSNSLRILEIWTHSIKSFNKHNRAQHYLSYRNTLLKLYCQNVHSKGSRLTIKINRMCKLSLGNVTQDMKWIYCFRSVEYMKH